MGLTWMKRAVIGVAVLLAIGFGVGSLGGSSGDVASVGPLGQDVAQGRGFAGGSSVRSAFGSGSADEADAGVARDEAPPNTTGPALPLGDRIIRTAELSLEVAEGSFDTAWTRALDVARRLRGSVLTSSTGSTTVIPSGELTIRVPTESFEEALIALRRLGAVRGDQTSSQDVTEEYIDLRARLRNLRAQESVMLKLMARAQTIQDTITVQSQLSEIQLEVERIVGRLSFLDARTEFSTITTRLAEPGGFLGGPAPRPDEPSFRRAWETALTGLERMGTAAMIMTLWLAPFALLAAIGAWAWGRGRRPVPHLEPPTAPPA